MRTQRPTKEAKDGRGEVVEISELIKQIKTPTTFVGRSDTIITISAKLMFPESIDR